MRNTLLTTTALVLTAGIASADGHATITWSGAATAGIARAGTAEAKAASGIQSASSKVAQAAAIADTDDTADATDTSLSAGTSTNSITTALLYQEQVIDDAEIIIDAATGNASTSTHTGTTAATIAADVATLRAEIVLDLADAATAKTVAASVAAVAEAVARTAALNKASALLDATFGTGATVKAGAADFDTYSEINATVTGSVALDNGMTVSVAMSVDAGTGYDFADDDGFDAAKNSATSSGIGLDNVTLNAGSLGTIKLDENAVTHLVDGDDDATADILYTNTFGAASVSVAMDIDKDTDLVARKASDTIGWTAGLDSTATLDTTGVSTVTSLAAIAADVAWSAKVSMPLAGGTAYVAMDEEGGNAFGASATLSGIGITFDSKLEALEEELSIDRSNTIGLSYAMGATTLGATWNSVEDGDQWGISAAYSAAGTTISASTDEGSDWSVSGSMALASGASVVAGTNYTEDAYLGLSFAF